MSDRILIRDLRVRAIIGCDDGERRARQGLVLNLVLAADLARPARSDALKDSVDYRAVAERVAALAETSRFFLLERLARAAADLVLEEFPAVGRVTVSIDKPGALKNARSVAVEITRLRNA